MGLLLGDVHPSEIERFDKSYATVGRELAIIRFGVIDTQPSHQCNICNVQYTKSMIYN